jgi:hypothetical protein
VGPDERPQLRRHGEGEQEVLGRHLPGELALEPLLALVVLAGRAVAMTAGMGHALVMGTFAAVDLHRRARLRAAVFHRGQRAVVLGPQPLAVLRAEVTLEGVDDGGEADHLICPQLTPKPSIRPLMRSKA